MTCGCYRSLRFLTVPWIGLQFLIVAFPGHAHLLLMNYAQIIFVPDHTIASLSHYFLMLTVNIRLDLVPRLWVSGVIFMTLSYTTIIYKVILLLFL